MLDIKQVLIGLNSAGFFVKLNQYTEQHLSNAQLTLSTMLSTMPSIMLSNTLLKHKQELKVETLKRALLLTLAPLINGACVSD